MKILAKAVPALLAVSSLTNYADSMNFYGGMSRPTQKETVARIAGIQVQPRTIIAKNENDVKERGDSDIKSSGNTDTITNVISYMEKKPVNQISGITRKEAELRIRLYREIQKHLGKPYVWGASGRRSFDCSSLMQAVYKDSLGVDIPRVSRDQGDRLGKKVPMGKMRMGDLIFMDTLNKGHITHVGMYVGNGEMIHASSTYGKVVRVKFQGFYMKTYRFSRSLFA